MVPAVVASSIAARSLGYAGIADLIMADQLGPQAIARLFANALAHDHGKVCAIVLLAGGTARYNTNRQGFDGGVERDLAIKALGGYADFAAANREAVRLVQRHWPEITAEAQSPAI